ncbi:low temperature requirement protein A [Actinomadura sp. J1-007]|uniref:low temperature requirement protein A n=1 Tax=Actinomadura sp. J1-007 TaxID=2661913 RepID=UPI0019D516E6|nr:low temperature requirement protein A [Actinomadura sp. J1-007]
MSDHPAVTPWSWRRRMRPRDPEETQRVSTPLELLFDLCFVVAIGTDSARLEESLAEGHTGSGIASFLLVFFAVWWAWMNFTWFASAYDADDTPYRLATMVVMAGVLILAAGVPRAFDDRDFAVVFAGYLVMRIGLESQRLRAAAADPERRASLMRYAAGESGCMVLWAVAIFAVPDGWRLPVWLVAAAAELLVPPWAERARSIPWHPHHITERYGLFTIIVLGETILSASRAVQEGIADEARLDLYLVAAGGLVTVFALWWVYFSLPSAGLLTRTRAAILWGYGHYVVFASGAAAGAGIAVNAALATHHAHVSRTAAGLALAVPVLCYLTVVWWLLVRPHGANAPYAWGMPLVGLLTLPASLTPRPYP